MTRLWVAVLLAGLATTHGFAVRGFVPAKLRPVAFQSRRASCAARCGRQRGASSLIMYDGDVATWIKRNFGETFFLAATYESDDKTLSKEWNYQRSWVDFAKLDRALRQKYPDQLAKLPPKPYLVGEESSFMPFQKYLETVLSIPGAYEESAVYEFLATPPDVITSAFRGRVPIDVVAEGGRYTGEKEGGGKYVPTLDPVMLAAEAGKTVKGAKESLAAAEISKKAGTFAAEKTSEWKEVAVPVVDEVSKAIADSGVTSKSSGKAVGGILANLRSGRGLFGEEATMAAVGKVTETIQEVMDESDGSYTADDKWDVVIEGPSSANLEVTVRPTQKAGLLLKAWLADNGIDAADAASYSLAVGGQPVPADNEIGQKGPQGMVLSVWSPALAVCQASAYMAQVLINGGVASIVQA